MKVPVSILSGILVNVVAFKADGEIYILSFSKIMSAPKDFKNFIKCNTSIS